MQIAEMVLAGEPRRSALECLLAAADPAAPESPLRGSNGLVRFADPADGAAFSRTRVLSLTLEADGLGSTGHQASLRLCGGFELRLRPPASARARLPALDHVAVCVYPENLDEYARLLCADLPDARCQRLQVGAADSGMRIVAIEDPMAGVHVVLAAPCGSVGQIAEFLAVTGCEGLQHVAYAVPSVRESLRALQDQGLRFVGATPECAEGAIIELREGDLSLRQVFTEPLWGEFFIEIMERNGIEGLRPGNMQSLYEINELSRRRVNAVPVLHSSR